MRKLTGLSVLIVDDEPLLREFIIDEFEARGAKVYHATGGKAAEEIMVGAHVDVVISDIRMPRGDGLSLLRWIRTQMSVKPLFLFVSGYSDLSESAAIDEGSLGVFDKPTDWDEVERLIIRSLPKKLKEVL